MARFDPKRIVVLVNGYEIKDWADGNDVISLAPAADAGAYTIGADGGGVFVAGGNNSATLTLKILQHSPTNKFMDDLKRLQLSDLKSFSPLTLDIRDLINEDLASAQEGYFTATPAFVRGAGHNATTWTIVFKTHNIKLEKGVI